MSMNKVLLNAKKSIRIDNHIINTIADEIDIGMDFDHYKIFGILQQCSAVTWQNVVQCRIRHRELGAVAVENSQFSVAGVGAPVKTLHLSLAGRVRNFLYKDNAGAFAVQI